MENSCFFTWVLPKIRVPQNRWFIMENPIKMDDLGGCHNIWKHPHVTMLRLHLQDLDPQEFGGNVTWKEPADATRVQDQRIDLE